jgi:hypothetical protein
MASQKARRPRAVQQTDAPGWFGLAGETVKFRLPSARDLAALVEGPRPESDLFRGCVEPADVPVRLRRRIERAMEALAPPLSRTLTGRCPECGRSIDIYFDVRSFVLPELREHAASVYQDVHLLALHYKWPEEDILALPRSRRMHYAEMLRDQGMAT